MLRIPKKAKVRINNVQYNQVKATKASIKEGDLVIDTKDNHYGYVCMKLVGRLAIRHGWTVEIGIPIRRVRKLVMTTENNSNN